MNNSPRWRLASQFVIITIFIYILLMSGGLLILRAELTNSLDQQLDSLLTELSDAIDYDNKILRLKKTKKIIKTQPLGRLARIEIFDEEEKLIEHHGVKGQSKFIEDTVEFKDGDTMLRSKSTPLETEDDKLVGFLQVQLPTVSRDRALAKYGVAMGFMTLFGLGILSIAGYIFSKKAASPLETSYLMLKQFSADAAHELHTPIATISAATDNMRGELDKPSMLEKRITVIERATSRIEKLVEDLMLLTRLGAETEEKRKAPKTVNLKVLVENVIHEFEARFEKKNLSIVQKKFEDCQVSGYEDELHQLVGNLLENAHKYTESDGTVTVSVGSESNNAVIKISDTGIGIPQESIPKLFDRFYRVDTARSRSVGGNGLGLSIVKAIVDMHNGSINVNSKPNQGSTFTVTLPTSGLKRM